MQNDNFDETMPSSPQGEEPEDLTHLEETQISPTAPADLAATQPFVDGELDPGTPDGTDDLPGDTQPLPKKAKKNNKLLRRISVGFSIFIAIVAIGAFSGFQIGLGDRRQNENVQRARIAAEQFQLAMVNMQDGDYTTASQRLEYVIKMYPDFPGAAEQLTIALLASQATTTPTVMPTATLEPTPDNREAEELIQQAQNSIAGGDWDTAIAALDTLRNTKPDFRTVDIDGMYYVALRNRGVKRASNGDLEGGIFDITQAELIAPVDAEANNWRTWAELYITGASFWEVDWVQVESYFSQIVPYAPNLMDSDFFTAQDRLATAHVESATTKLDQIPFLMADRYWCTANEIFNEISAVGALDPEIVPTAEFVRSKCELSPNSFAP